MRVGRFAFLLLLAVAAGCGTTRSTDTQRAASEMMLVSQAIDHAVGQLDFSALNGKTVFLDVQYLDGTVDRGYLVSSLRQHLLAHGALLQEDRQRALYVVEPRAGAVGTDRHSLLVGVPSMSLPPVVPGVPTAIPEIGLIKRTDQKGIAKIAVFAYNRVTGRALWQSGLLEADSHLKDTWVFGAGPYSRGSILKEPRLAGEELPELTLPFGGKQYEPPLSAWGGAEPPPPPGRQHMWTNADDPMPPQPVAPALMAVTGPAAIADRKLIRYGQPLPDPAAVELVQPPATPQGPIMPAGPAIPVSVPGGTIQPPPGPLPKLN
jgi:hypothetical protein